MSKINAGYTHYRMEMRAAIKSGTVINCALCTKRIRFREDFSVDHILPKSRGGRNQLENYQPAHWWCNRAKGNMFQHEFEGTDLVATDKEASND